MPEDTSSSIFAHFFVFPETNHFVFLVLYTVHKVKAILLALGLERHYIHFTILYIICCFLVLGFTFAFCVFHSFPVY